ncbi:MAG: YicC family protein [Thiomicrospira sp.]|uniref:YicC/YloC family endoribonuclease n=1 Tax=Thiomicrospira sp. TaxID=935 RepID=UPI0019E462A1|nr:YicC/YloC family endoribonuclease [Thiomicrospira sp.]MBE0494468.1 YicC family protein [Thiomicrospira sp.]
MKSMTAFANTSHTTEWGQIQWEIRAVNQRYLELTFRLPDAYRSLEMPLRDLCKQQLERGKVELGLKLELNQAQQDLPIDEARLSQLNQAICHIQQRLPEATQINPLEILQWPGLLQTQSFDVDQIQTDLLASFELALQQLNESRQREGQQLAQLILQRVDAIREQLHSLNPILPSLVQDYQQRLRERIQELSEQLDESRLAMEVAILAQKIDVAEELDRIHTHLDEVVRVANQPGAIGRRLDFLMQELNRESNTLGAKSIDARVTQVSVELKVLIEQMREQVQNIV